MIKRTLYFGNPAYLSLKLKQLVVRLPQNDGEQKDEKELTRTVPIEDLGQRRNRNKKEVKRST